MSNCPNCALKKSRWASTKGFNIGKKTYCCLGCGFTGCICIDPRPRNKRKSHITITPSAHKAAA